MIKKLTILLALAMLGQRLSAQVFTDASAFHVYGKASEATKTRYQRLPAELEGISRAPTGQALRPARGLH